MDDNLKFFTNERKEIFSLGCEVACLVIIEIVSERK